MLFPCYTSATIHLPNLLRTTWRCIHWISLSFFLSPSMRCSNDSIITILKLNIISIFLSSLLLSLLLLTWLVRVVVAAVVVVFFFGATSNKPSITNGNNHRYTGLSHRDIIHPHTHKKIETSYQSKGNITTYSFLFKFVSRFILFAAATVAAADAAATATAVRCFVLSCTLYFCAVQPIHFNFVFFSLLARLSIRQIRWIRFRFIHCALFDGMTTRNARNKYENTPKHTYTSRIMYARNKR